MSSKSGAIRSEKTKSGKGNAPSTHAIEAALNTMKNINKNNSMKLLNP